MFNDITVGDLRKALDRYGDDVPVALVGSQKGAVSPITGVVTTGVIMDHEEDTVFENTDMSREHEETAIVALYFDD